MRKPTPGMEHLPWRHKLGDLLFGPCTARPWTPSRKTFDLQLSVSQVPASKPEGEAPQCLALCPSSNHSPSHRLSAYPHMGNRFEEGVMQMDAEEQHQSTSPRRDQELLHAVEGPHVG